MRRAGLVAWVVVLVGLAGTVVALRSRGSNPQFVAAQQSLAPVTAGALERLIATTRDPRPGFDGGRARSAVCQAGSTSGLGNPWACVVRYQQLPIVSFNVLVSPDGSIAGVQTDVKVIPGGGVVHLGGCCVAGVS